MVTLETSGHTTERLDHPNPEEAEENDFKLNFMKMETFKEEMKNSHREMEEMTNKNWKTLINPSKKPKNTKKKQTGEGNSLRLEN